MIGIYKIENIINHKVYIGQSWNIENRFTTHKNINQERNTHLKNAFNIYGHDNFRFTILVSLPDKYTTQHILDKAEQMYIDAYDSTDRSKGYNLKGGGSHGKHVTETKNKISKTLSGRTHEGRARSLETRRKISMKIKGRTLSEEWKQKIAASRKKQS